MKRIITGITATNNLTLGNYIGAMLPLLKEQEKIINEKTDDEILIFVADLHAVSQNVDRNSLRDNIENLIYMYLATGFDNLHSKIFIQSEIIGHTELTWLLSGNVYLGELQRMTQFKDKSNTQKEKNGTINISSSLLFYPILMAADILIYNSNYVIVGKDQKQHLELTKIIAERMNKKYGTNIVIPEPKISSSTSKIMSLKNPNKKMSKSDSDKDATIFLLDDSKEIIRKIMSAITDSENKVYYDVQNKPGVSNLLVIYSSIKKISIKQAEEFFKDYTYKEFKESVANVVSEHLSNLQKKYYEFKNAKINIILEKNRSYVQNLALKNLNDIKEKMGF